MRKIGGDNEELLSREDLINKIDKVNGKVKKEGEDIVVGSIDVEKLYPKMDMEMAAEEIRKEIVETEVKFEGIDE